MRSGTVRGGGCVDLHADDTGTANGAPILFVHGYSQSRLSWRNQVESDLAEVFRFVSIDNRGHGLSDKLEDAYGDSRL